MASLGAQYSLLDCNCLLTCWVHIHWTLSWCNKSAHHTPACQQPSSVLSTLPSSLTHTTLFTTRILVLKFVNEGVILEEIHDSHFPRKRGILVLTSVNLEKNGLYFNSSVLQWKSLKRVFIWAEKSVFYCKKGVHFELKSQYFIVKNGLFSDEKSVFCHKKGGHFQNGEQGWVPLCPLSEGVGIIWWWTLACQRSRD